MLEDDFLVVWRILCRKTGKTFIQVDEGDDPEFCCPICEVEHNHLPQTVRYLYNSLFEDYDHVKALVGRVTYKELEKLALLDVRGW